MIRRIVVTPGRLSPYNGLVHTNIVAFVFVSLNQIPRRSDPFSPVVCTVRIHVVDTKHPGYPIAATYRVGHFKDRFGRIPEIHIGFCIINRKQIGEIGNQFETIVLYSLCILNYLSVIAYRFFCINTGQQRIGD